MRKLLVFFFIPINCFAQNTIGLPDVINYPKKTYAAGLQNWDIKQDKNNIIYIANNEGLLTYDGRFWNLYPLPNKTIVRSVAIGENNLIYVGGQDEIGYYAPFANGTLKYHSIINLLQPKDRAFGDVWDIEIFKKDIYFRTNNKIFRLIGNSVAVYEAPQEWAYLGLCGDQLYAHDFNVGLMMLKNNAWQPVYRKENLGTNDPVTSILPISKDSILITTLKNGIFLGTKTGVTRLNFPLVTAIAKERIYDAKLVTNNWIALATNNAGVYIIDLNGNLIQRFSGNEGLQNNNVLSIFLDKQRNLWLGLNNGIDFVAYNSAIKHINPSIIDGSGYTMLVSNNNLYAGTSAGLFYTQLQAEQDLSFSKGFFNQVYNTVGQVWNLAEINGQVLVGQHEGAYVIKDNTATPLVTKTGFWNFEPESAVFPSERIISGNYQGLTFLNYKNNSFSEAETIIDFKETSRFTKIDKFGNIWVSHPYHGVYKLVKTDSGKYSITIYTHKNGLPSTLNNHIYKVSNEIIVATEKGIYSYNTAQDKFEPSAYYLNLLGQQSIRYVKEDNDGNIWFIHEKQLGVVDLSSPKKSIIYFPELNNKMLSGFEFIYTLNKYNIFVGGENGFFHINFYKYKKNLPELKTSIRSVKITDTRDSVLYGGYQADSSGVNKKPARESISKNWKSIHFEFSSPLYGQQENLEYSYRLINYTKIWSEWSNRTDKEFSNLPHGNYTFEVKARNNLGNESAVASYNFKILPSWYQTYWAYFVYACSFIIGNYWLFIVLKKKFRQQQQKHEEEQKRLLYLHQLELEKTEKEIVKLKNEKLEAEIQHKNTELASVAMHLVQKGELLGKVKDQMVKLKKSAGIDKESDDIKKIIRVISEEDMIDKQWEQFTMHFDNVHSDFLAKLKLQYPALSANELKLSAYLRMNLSTKEIAQLMNISVRGVEISRYRLRKKLQIPTEINLFDFLVKLETEKEQ